MSNVLNRTTKQYLSSVNEPEYPVVDWIHAPDISAVIGVDSKYWTITGDVVSEMSQVEKDAVDAAEAQAQLTMAREDAINEVVHKSGIGIRTRTLLELGNKRDNYILRRVKELQVLVIALHNAILNSTGGAQTIRDALAGVDTSLMNINIRARRDAIQNYKDDIATGENDNE